MAVRFVCALLLLGHSINAVVSWNQRRPPSLFGRPPGGFLNNALSGMTDIDPDLEHDLQEFTIEQYIDHSNAALGKFNQLVQYLPTFYSNSSLAFLMISGESEASKKWITSNYSYINWARQYGAAVFQLEHRFFGQSRPYNNMETASFQYLTVTQAIEDIAEFISQMNIKYEFKKWVTFGGSYAGMLNAWMRAEKPELTVGAVASSAPLDISLDSFFYGAVMEEVLDRTNITCKENVGKAFTAIIEKCLTKEGREELGDKLSLTPRFDEAHLEYLDIQNLVINLYTVFQDVVQYTYDGRAWENMHGRDVANLCAKMNNESLATDPVLQVRSVIEWANSFFSNETFEFQNSYAELIAPLANTTYDDNDLSKANGRAWMWLCCNEIGGMITTDMGRNLFGSAVPLNYYIDMCTDLFGETMKAQTIRDNNLAAMKKFPQPDVYTATNIVLPNGSFDPWSAYGVYRNVTDKHMTAFSMYGAGHCADMYPEWSGEPASLSSARALIEKEIEYFIS